MMRRLWRSVVPLFAFGVLTACGQASTSSPIARPAPSPSAEMPAPLTCKSSSPFVNAKGIHILVARFDGSPTTFAAEARHRVRINISDMTSESEPIEVVDLEESFERHPDAQACATKLSADAVAWGTADANGSTTEPKYLVRPRVTLRLGGEWINAVVV